MSRKLSSADDSITSEDPTPYATEVVRQAYEAKAQPTFGVGGALLKNFASQGEWVTAMHNNVLENRCINDPTAHGER